MESITGLEWLISVLSRNDSKDNEEARDTLAELYEIDIGISSITINGAPLDADCLFDHEDIPHDFKGEAALCFESEEPEEYEYQVILPN